MPTRPPSAVNPTHSTRTEEKAADEDDTQPIVRRRTTQPTADDTQPVVRRRTTQPRSGDEWTAPIGRRETKEQAYDRETRVAEQALAWDDDDPRCPTNWSVPYRCWLTALVSLCTINATLPSALPSVAIREMSADLGISIEVTELVTSLFLLGCETRLYLAVLTLADVAGPIVWGPASVRSCRATQHSDRRRKRSVASVRGDELRCGSTCSLLRRRDAAMYGISARRLASARQRCGDAVN